MRWHPAVPRDGTWTERRGSAMCSGCQRIIRRWNTKSGWRHT